MIIEKSSYITIWPYMVQMVDILEFLTPFFVSLLIPRCYESRITIISCLAATTRKCISKKWEKVFSNTVFEFK